MKISIFEQTIIKSKVITRIKINGFKSLLDTELYLGPFTCIAGANAAGKSNFFDALMFFAHLADKTILEAAKSIRSEEQKHSNIKDIFFKCGDKQYQQMDFEIDLLVPKSAEDDLGQVANTSVSCLKYKLKLQLNGDIDDVDRQPIEILEEALMPMTRQDAQKSIGFVHNKEWSNSIFYGQKSSPIISTKNGKIKLHQDTQGKSGGRAAEFMAQGRPRTLLSTVTAESPTAFLVRQEMRNWQMLQFEPSALRQPNSFHEILHSKVDENGKNLPATLYRLAQNSEEDIYQIITNQLRNLVSDIKIINVDKDEKRELLTLVITFKNGLELPAQSLSDGTLRFLGLAIIQEDSRDSLICMEEPENGINPKKIEEIVELLLQLSFDPLCPVNDDNPIRQVVINTHSPKLIGIVPEDSLYLACAKEKYDEILDIKVQYTSFSILPNTYKKKKYESIPTTLLGEMKLYLDNDSVDNTIYIPRIRDRKSRTVRENILYQESIIEPKLF